MSFSDFDGSDWERYEHFAESRDLDPEDNDLQDAYFTFIFEHEGYVDRYDEDSLNAFIDFLDAIGYEYDDIDEVLDRYSDT